MLLYWLGLLDILPDVRLLLLVDDDTLRGSPTQSLTIILREWHRIRSSRRRWPFAKILVLLKIAHQVEKLFKNLHTGQGL